jgi:ElaB/YqjD/DUF883 family membrane-anchored ribosome-binding protein
MQESEDTMKIRTLLGLTVIGSAAYAHKRHGGTFSVESMKQSLQDLWTGIQGRASDAKAKAAELTDKAQDKMKSVADRARSGADSAAATAKDALGSSASKPTEHPSPYGSNRPLPGNGGRGR